MSLSIKQPRLNHRYRNNVQHLPIAVRKNLLTQSMLQRLCDCADDTGQGIYISNERLATELLSAVSTVRVARRHLEGTGLLVTVTERAGRTTVQRLDLARFDALLAGRIPAPRLALTDQTPPATGGVNEPRKATQTPPATGVVTVQTPPDTGGVNEQRKRKSDDETDLWKTHPTPPITGGTPPGTGGTPPGTGGVLSTQKEKEVHPSTPEGGTGVPTGVGVLADPKSESQNPGLRPSALLTDKNRRLTRKFVFEGLDTGLWGNPLSDGPDGLRMSELMDDLKRFVARSLGLSGRDVSALLGGLVVEIEQAWKRKRGIERAPNPWAGDRRVAR